MGVSNLKIGLGRKYASWAGEQLKLEREIAKTEKAMKTLQDKKERVKHLKKVQKAAIVVMQELDPTWDHKNVTPSIPHTQKIPGVHGEATRTTFEIIRELGKPFNPKELAPQVLVKMGLDPNDPDLVKRMTEGIDAMCRQQKGKLLRVVSIRPTYWEIIDDAGLDESSLPD